MRREYEPYKDNLYIIKMHERLKANRSFKMVFKRDLTELIYDDLKNISDPNHNFTTNTVINVSGLTGSSKSMSVISLGLRIFKNFSWKNMFFYDEQILQNAGNIPPNSFIVRDENPQKAIYGIGSARTTAQIRVLAETCRKYGLNLCFIEPEFVQSGVAKLILETVDMDIKRRITRLAVRDTHTLQYIGAMYIDVVSEKNEDWIRYNEVKDKFIDDMRLGRMSGSKASPSELAQGIIEEIDFEIYKTKKEVKAFIIDKYPNYTSGEIDLIATNVWILMKKNLAR